MQLQTHAQKQIPAAATATTAPAIRWITEKEYASIHGLHRQTLANWRHVDKLAGREFAAAGYPVYKRFGRAIRYQVEVYTGAGSAA
jgi:hypothetical protein